MTPGRTAKRDSPEEAWRGMLYGTHPGLKLERRVWRLLSVPSALQALQLALWATRVALHAAHWQAAIAEEPELL